MLVDADDQAFDLTTDDAGAVAVAADGNILARLAPGRSLLEPALRTARALDRLSAPTRAALRDRLERWLDAQIDRHLRPLAKLSAAALTRPVSGIPQRILAKQRPVYESMGFRRQCAFAL